MRRGVPCRGGQGGHAAGAWSGELLTPAPPPPPAVFIRAIPALQRLGWTDIALVPGFQDHEAWASADVVVMRYNGDVGALQKLFREGKATQRYVLLDRGDSSTLSPGYSYPSE